MGLQYAFHVVNQLVQQRSITDLGMDNFTLIFDGLFFIYSHQFEPTIEDIVTKIIRTIEIHVIQLRTYGYRFETKFMVDGKSPYAKKYTQSKRKHVLYNDLNQIKSLLKNRLSERGIEFVELKKGEVEAEAVHSRTGPVLILTNDSDMFHIGYGYALQNENDKVLFAKKNFDVIYDFSQPLVNIHKNLLKFILFCCGSDFTCSIITKTMLEKIMTKIHVLEQIKLDVYNVDILKLLVILLYCLSQDANYPRKKLGIQSLDEYCESLDWCIQYSNKGVVFEKYDDKISYCHVDAISVLLNALDQFTEPQWKSVSLKQRIASINTSALVRQIQNKIALLKITSNTPKQEV